MASRRPSHIPEEIDLRAEDDELIAAELEAAMEAEREKAEAEAPSATAHREDKIGQRSREPADADEAVVDANPRAKSGPLEGTFDHGEEGYGLWLDPAIQDNPIYAEHWAGHRSIEVTVEEDRIVIRRTGGSDD